ncbi:TylF/MycF family methyltransferase [Actinoalloteichus caeruleus]|uniref:O-methyltransferase n=1 Tax=Actinoalloteichus caeruleus DSM 43889 TaxID=1120930 RepID=A0ABT1JD96_ACTCY|nr:TylF/MycF family methyltransferase [Actinoalloteichus caeruleus]MCP2330179.1 O-methyltransferase [Actinoalloteichus caeruleus DSM 43889]
MIARQNTSHSSAPDTSETGAALYLDLLERVVTNLIYEDDGIPNRYLPDGRFDLDRRQNGIDWPSVAHTMVGLERVRNVRYCLERVLAEGVPGDFIETGVWRGGVCVFARGVLKAYGCTDRAVWVADSFQGIPDTGPDGHHLDRALALHEANHVLGVPLDVVRRNFQQYGLLDDQVRFLPGWFRDTLPTAPMERLAVLRLDGDLYESTTDALTNLYPKLSPGGFVIIDDFVIEACAQAVHDFRQRAGVEEPLVAIDDGGVYWRREN